jgi:rubrerythrin
MLFLRRELADGLDTQQGLQDAVQVAIRLEHSTIPPYLYALYSIKPGTNTDVADLILSVVMEEMLHLALACNLLNALGGSPAIDSPNFLPKYPGPLPGTVEHDLQVGLKKLTVEHVHDTFMAIEEPEDPLNFRAEAAVERLTIGQFYGRIKDQLPGARFDGDPALQLTGDDFGGLFPITNADEAAQAIDLIVEQGEGTTTSPLDGGTDGDLAHYYRFAEIYHGHKLVATPHPGQPPDQQYAYTGDPITIDPAGIQPAIDNPTRAAFAGAPVALALFDKFNFTYAVLLRTLHAAFNGTPNDINTAFGIMDDCKAQALALMATALPDGTHAGPGFQWPTPGP